LCVCFVGFIVGDLMFYFLKDFYKGVCDGDMEGGRGEM